MKSLLLTLSVLILFSHPIISQISDKNYFEKNSEVYFSFQVNDKQQLRVLSDIVSIDNVKFNTVYAYANESEYGEFLKLNIEHLILPHPSSLIIPEMSNNIEEIEDWNVYPTYSGYLSMMQQFADTHPSICSLIDAGNTVQGRKILFIKISDNVYQREVEPQFMFTSSIHGDELAGYVLMLRLIDSILTSYGSNQRITNLVNNAEIWINPLANPDGTYHGGNNTVSGATRYNANGYDLNRNFPDPVNGIHPNQQTETAVFRYVAEQNNFVLCANFHGGEEVVNYPWDTWTNQYPDYKHHPDENWYEFISHMYADTCQTYAPAGYMDGFNDGITNGGAWYIIHGGRQDYTNFYRHGREVTIEISDTKLLPASLLPAWWNYNKRSFLNYMENVLYGIKGIVTDTSGNPLKAKIIVINHDSDSSEVYSDLLTGSYYRMIAPGTYDLLFTKPGFISKQINNVSVINFSISTVNVELVPQYIPVELSSFYAEVLDQNVDIYWTTSTETNNKEFELQRRIADSGNWVTVVIIKGTGTSTIENEYSYTDLNLKPGTYNYRLKQIDYSGDFQYSEELMVKVDRPKEFVLKQNYPNPFNPVTKIDFTIPEKAFVSLKIFDILGREVLNLVNEEKDAGNYSVSLNLGNMTSGLFFCQLNANENQQTIKMILMK
ncbi:MAG: T9SS type A sorting domain-containing protein [Ignavibacteriaceae bacterium]|nr:T9SS type A sorting domain-containing protein [Ignavibacteriaceae bacterium]